jgi:O-methyltransferase involved in polyketide biosynthesis
MNSVNKTLYIPLFSKAFVSKKGIILSDKKAEEIINKEKVSLKGKAKSKWLAYFMAMRAKVFDEWVVSKVKTNSNAIILHFGCGLDSRVERLKIENNLFIDIDFPAVIEEKKRYFLESENYKMIAVDVREDNLFSLLPHSENVVAIFEGISMYLTNDELKNILVSLSKKYKNLSVLLDCYTTFGAKMSKIKNPVKSVGVKEVYGLKDHKVLEENTSLAFIKEHSLTPSELIDELKGFERFIFKNLYAGKTSKKIYKMYEYKK